jgi:phosphatidylglycerophosphate synthase
MSPAQDSWTLLLAAPFLAYFAVRFVWYGALVALGRTRPFDQETQDRGASLLLGPTVRQVYAWSLEPFVRFFARARVRPNTLTLACLLLSVAGGLAVGAGAVTFGGVLGFFGVSFDYFDGRIARRLGESTRSGGFLDSTLDRFGEVAFFAGAAVHFRHALWILVACLCVLGASGIVSYTRAKAESLGIELKSGLMQRAERVVLYCAGAGLGALFDPWLPPELQGRDLVFAGVLCVLAVLTMHTAIGRTARAFLLLSQAERADKPDR